MVGIVVVQCVCAVLITAMSTLGVWAPLACMSGTVPPPDTAVVTVPVQDHVDPMTQQGRRRAEGHVLSRRTRVVLAVANCFAAGMLVTMATTHFLPVAMTEAGASPVTVAFWVLLGVLVPAFIECSTTTAGHSHGAGSHKGESGAASLSTATLLILLMCFHGAMEGLVLGLESRAEPLLDTVVPLTLHKFLDGIVVGVSLAKEYARRLDGEARVRMEMMAERTHVAASIAPLKPAHAPPLYDTWRRANGVDVHRDVLEDGVVYSAERHAVPLVTAPLPPPQRSLWRVSVVAWLLLTPAMMLMSALLYGGTRSGSGDKPHVERSAGSNDVGVAHTPLLTIVHSLGSGAFLYIGLSLLMQEDTGGAHNGLALLLGAAATYTLFYFKNMWRGR